VQNGALLHFRQRNDGVPSCRPVRRERA
jgi:hypothetical protein